MYPGSPLGHRDKACWFNCSNIQHRPTSGPIRGLYCNDPARGAGRRAVAGGRLTRVSRAPGVPVRGGTTGVRDTTRAGGAPRSVRRAAVSARRRVTATPGPAVQCGGGARAGNHDRRQKPVLKHGFRDYLELVCGKPRQHGSARREPGRGRNGLKSQNWRLLLLRSFQKRHSAPRALRTCTCTCRRTRSHYSQLCAGSALGQAPPTAAAAQPQGPVRAELRAGGA